MTERRATSYEVVMAIRLALEGAADDHSALEITRALLSEAPASNGSDTRSLALLLSALRGRGRVEVAP